MCNQAGSQINTGLWSNSIELNIDSDTVDELVYAMDMGAGTSALVAILSQQGVITAPPGWVAAAIGIVLGMIGRTLAYIDNGCGVTLSITVYTALPTPVYSISAQ